MKINVLSGGPLSTIQDLGRTGHMQSGFSPNGAMDKTCAVLANLLVGNPRHEGVIEMTLSGMRIAFDCPGAIALTGADMKPELNGVPVNMDETILVQDGDVLTMRMAEKGLRTYLAVAGGFAVEPVMGSVSTNLKCGIGGWEGRKLRTGDEIPLRCAVDPVKVAMKKLPQRSERSGSAVLRAVPGPQDDYFFQQEIGKFFSSVYTATSQLDRMGIRFDGEPVKSLDGVDIVSDGIVTGSVQIPPSGLPIVMMADRQTTGGYAKIATVITPDLRLLAQLRPGDTVQFVRISQREAEKINRREQRELKRMERRLLRMR